MKGKLACLIIKFSVHFPNNLWNTNLKNVILIGGRLNMWKLFLLKGMVVKLRGKK